MKLTVIENKKYLRVVESTEMEIEQMKFSLKKRIRGWFFNPLVKKKLWDGYINFYKDGLIPVGLWHEVYNIGECFSFPVEIDNINTVFDETLDEEDFRSWCENFFADNPKFKPRDYQIDSALDIMKYKVCTSEIATSAGKTLISFMVYAYLKEKGILKRMMVIVPNTTLVMQMRDDWEEYANGKIAMKMRQVYGGSKDNDPSVDIIVGTFQSLTKKRNEYFKGTNVVFVDECHQTGTVSIKNILKKCIDAEYRFGMSGTVKNDNSADFFVIESYLGPVVTTISPKFLFKEGYATPVKFRMIVLEYPNDDIKKKLYELRKAKDLEKSTVFALEKTLVVKSRLRFKIVTDLISKTTKNSMVLFSNVKDKYGKNIYEWLKENTEKTVFYVDGQTSKEHRDFYKKEMESGNDKIIVASFTTFSTGISIKNVHNIFFVESFKSETIIKQSIGRGMRQLKNKNEFTVIDIVDDMSYGNHSNYLYKHGKERLKFYREYTSDIIVKRVKI